jgi:bacteriocin-like protein
MKELSKNELMEIEGGYWFIATMVAGVVYDLISNPSQTVASAKDGFNYVYSL